MIDKILNDIYNNSWTFGEGHRGSNIIIEVWLSLVERCVRDAEVAGSNPVTSIFLLPGIPLWFSGIFIIS